MYICDIHAPRPPPRGFQGRWQGITGRGRDGDVCEACECECDERLGHSHLTLEPSQAVAAAEVLSVKGVAEGHARGCITTKQLD